MKLSYCADRQTVRRTRTFLRIRHFQSIMDVCNRDPGRVLRYPNIKASDLLTSHGSKIRFYFSLIVLKQNDFMQVCTRTVKVQDFSLILNATSNDRFYIIRFIHIIYRDYDFFLNNLNGCTALDIIEQNKNCILCKLISAHDKIFRDMITYSKRLFCLFWQ